MISRIWCLDESGDYKRKIRIAFDIWSWGIYWVVGMYCEIYTPNKSILLGNKS